MTDDIEQSLIGSRTHTWAGDDVWRVLAAATVQPVARRASRHKSLAGSRGGQVCLWLQPEVALRLGVKTTATGHQSQGKTRQREGLKETILLHRAFHYINPRVVMKSVPV